MFRITRTSAIPGSPLEITFNEPIQHAPIVATPADASGKPTFEAVVTDEVADHIRADAGLSQHFSVSPLRAGAAKGARSSGAEKKATAPLGAQDAPKTE